MSKRNRYSAEQKVQILREQLENNQSVSDICEKYRVHPNQFYQWRKTFFEKAVEVFASNRDRSHEQRRIEKLEERLRDRNEVIAELLQENLKLKKLDGEI